MTNISIEYLNDTSVSIMQQKSEKQKLVKINDKNNSHKNLTLI